MSCPDPICRLVTCVVTDDIPSYLGDYSLQTGSQFVNLEMSIPAGGGFYIVAPGTIVINVPPNPQFISYQGCKSMVNETVPPGATPAQILQIVSDVMNQVGTQLSLCNAPTPTGSPFVEGSFTNGPVSVNCGGGLLMNQVNPLPNFVTFSISALSIVGGIFSSSTSQADADNQAEIFLDSLLDADVQCGFWNAEQSFTCPDMSVKTVAADTVFSTVSQADADAQALAMAQAECVTAVCPPVSGFSWTITPSNPLSGSGFMDGNVNSSSASGGTLNFDISAGAGFPTPNPHCIQLEFACTIINTNASDCHYQIVASGSSPNMSATLAGDQVSITLNGVLVAAFNTTSNTPWATQGFTVPAMSTLNFSLVFFCQTKAAPTTLGAFAATLGTFVISLI